MKTKKIIINAKDVMRMTNMSERYAHLLLTKIRIFFKKEKYQFVTVLEFSQFSGISVDEIEDYI